MVVNRYDLQQPDSLNLPSPRSLIHAPSESLLIPGTFIDTIHPERSRILGRADRPGVLKRKAVAVDHFFEGQVAQTPEVDGPYDSFWSRLDVRWKEERVDHGTALRKQRVSECDRNDGRGRTDGGNVDRLQDRGRCIFVRTCFPITDLHRELVADPDARF